jgi:hypothetical protein
MTEKSVQQVKAEQETKPPAHYVLCRRKRGLPRMDVRVCEKRCPIKGDCREFKEGKHGSK